MKKKIITLIIVLGIIFIPYIVHAETKVDSYIDYPKTSVEGEELYIQGWVMSDVKAKVEAYINNEKIELERYERQDVINAITGYDNEINQTPGYKKTLDISNYNDGKYTFKILIKNEETDEKINEETIYFNLKKYKTLINIDYPNTKVEKDNLLMQGWVMSTTNSYIKTYIDNIDVTDNIERQARPDVIKAINGYGDITTNQTPGYKGNIDISNITDGNHTIRIEVYSTKTNKEIARQEKNIIINKYKTLINIDYPNTKVEKDNLLMQGWVMSTTNSYIKTYIDNIDVTDNIERQARPDVIKAINGYGDITTNQTPGYKGNIDISNITDGNHTIRIEVYSTKNSELISTMTKTITIKKVIGELCIDYLEQARNTKTYYLQAWEMSSQKDSYIKVFIDNKEINFDGIRAERPDVIKVITKYGDSSVNPTPGIQASINIENISLGTHNVKIKLYSKYNEEICIKESNIHIYNKSYDSSGKLHYNNMPYYNQHDGRWDKIRYGLSIFGNNGCTPTALAMAFSGILGREILPTEIGNYLYNTGTFNRYTKGTNGLGIIYATDNYHIKRSPINNLNDLNNALESGKMVYAAMGNGIYGTTRWNHAIILYNYSDGKTYSTDPLNTNNNRWIETSTVWNQRSVDRDDYRGGAVFYALESYK